MCIIRVIIFDNEVFVLGQELLTTYEQDGAVQQTMPSTQEPMVNSSEGQVAVAVKSGRKKKVPLIIALCCVGAALIATLVLLLIFQPWQDKKPYDLLIGKWKTANGVASLEFKDDGTFIFTGSEGQSNQGTYTIDKTEKVENDGKLSYYTMNIHVGDDDRRGTLYDYRQIKESLNKPFMNNDFSTLDEILIHFSVSEDELIVPHIQENAFGAGEIDYCIRLTRAN